jgi:predicted ArsR family transcriptional regulator
MKKTPKSRVPGRFAEVNGSASIYAAMAVLLQADAPLDHVEIAERLSVPKYRACRLLAYLEKTGRVVCLRRSRLGLGNLPGVWRMTEDGRAWAMKWCMPNDLSQATQRPKALYRHLTGIHKRVDKRLNTGKPLKS